MAELQALVNEELPKVGPRRLPGRRPRRYQHKSASSTGLISACADEFRTCWRCGFQRRGSSDEPRYGHPPAIAAVVSASTHAVGIGTRQLLHRLAQSDPREGRVCFPNGARWRSQLAQCEAGQAMDSPRRASDPTSAQANEASLAAVAAPRRSHNALDHAASRLRIAERDAASGRVRGAGL